MHRSGLRLERTNGSSEDNPPDTTSSGSLHLPVAIMIGSLLLSGIWFFQQTSLRHLNEQIYQLQQNIDKLPNRAISPVTRLSLDKEQILLERDRINAQNGVYNVLFQGIGTLLLGGLTYAGWQQLRRTGKQLPSTQGSTTDRFSQAIAHLASDKVEIRLGGIYTLERIAQESPTEHWLTIEILTAFVRERSIRVEATPPPSWQQPPRVGDPILPTTSHRRLQSSRIPTDIQAVITILNRRDTRQDRPDRIIELRESNLRHANLSGIELWGANLWKVNLRHAQLWQAKLAGASLGRANLSDASLWQADLEGAYLWKANLEGANLEQANLAQANLEGSNLKGANLLHTNLINTDLRKTIGLTRQQLSQAICDETTQLPDYLEAVNN